MNNQEFKRELIRRAYKFSLNIIKLIGGFPRANVAIEVLARQLLRSSTSIGANIIEAQAASSQRDFTNFMSHALKSANETKYWLGLLRDSGSLKKEQASLLLQEVIEIAKLLGSSVLALKQRK